MDSRSKRRIERLETLVAQQGYLVLILMVLVIIDTAGLLFLWGERGPPNFDHIAISLTIFQTLFGIAAVYGFWALRGVARDKAQEAAEEEVRKLAPSLVRRQVAEALQTFGRETPISRKDVDEMVDAIGEDGEDGE